MRGTSTCLASLPRSAGPRTCWSPGHSSLRTPLLVLPQHRLAAFTFIYPLHLHNRAHSLLLHMVLVWWIGTDFGFSLLHTRHARISKRGSAGRCHATNPNRSRIQTKMKIALCAWSLTKKTTSSFTHARVATRSVGSVGIRSERSRTACVQHAERNTAKLLQNSLRCQCRKSN